jgi:predicted PolB exonuclease-like 3'-5' exonuclease
LKSTLSLCIGAFTHGLEDEKVKHALENVGMKQINNYCQDNFGVINQKKSLQI